LERFPYDEDALAEIDVAATTFGLLALGVGSDLAAHGAVAADREVFACLAGLERVDVRS
jgi:hypothetical protein